ncbi:MAG: murein biosynthesis integral membrane protein MurJ [Akkermansia sp.]
MSLMRNSLVASGAIFACRLTGMAREIVYTSLFGATGALDAFYTAFRIPNLLRDLFAEGALSQSYTSVASKTREAQGEAAAWELTNKVATQLSALMIAIVTLGIHLPGPVWALYSGDHSLTDQLFATDLSRIMWPFIGFASLSALIMGALNMVGVFGLPMLASAAFNVTSILLGLLIGYFIDPSFGPKALYGFACGVTIGGMAQIAVQLPKLSKTGFRWKPNFQWDDPRVRKIWGLMLPSVLASGVTQFTIFINTGFALTFRKAPSPALTTAFRLCVTSRGSLRRGDGHGGPPAVSRMMVGDGRKEVAVHIAKGLRLVAFFAVPAFLILSILGTEFVSAVYQWGRFNQEAVRYTGEVLGAYSLGLLGYAGTKVVQPVFLALEKRWVPLIAAAVALAISIGLNYYFVGLHKNAAWLALTTSWSPPSTSSLLLTAPPAGRRGRWTLFSGLGRILAAESCWEPCWAGKTWFLQDFLNWSFPARLWASPRSAAPGSFTWRRLPVQDAGTGRGTGRYMKAAVKLPFREGRRAPQEKEWPSQAFSLPGCAQ